MKATATTRFIHGAISAKSGDEVTASEVVIKELAEAGLVSLSVPPAKAAKKAAKRAAKTVQPPADTPATDELTGGTDGTDGGAGVPAAGTDKGTTQD